MNKRAAKKATDEFTGTIGDLRAMIVGKSDAGGFSVVNPAIPLPRALYIYATALKGRDDSEAVTIWKPDPYSRNGGMKRTLDAVIVQNILRDCA